MHTQLSGLDSMHCKQMPFNDVMVQEYVYVEESDMGGEREGGEEGGASEPPQPDMAESTEWQTPKKERKSVTPAK